MWPNSLKQPHLFCLCTHRATIICNVYDMSSLCPRTPWKGCWWLWERCRNVNWRMEAEVLKNAELSRGNLSNQACQLSHILRETHSFRINLMLSRRRFAIWRIWSIRVTRKFSAAIWGNIYSPSLIVDAMIVHIFAIFVGVAQAFGE